MHEFMVTERCEGNLSEYVTGQLPTIRKGVIDDQVMLGQLIVGLSYLHEEGIIHKDLKPENILLWQGANGLVLTKLADFGYSRQLPEEKKSFDVTNHLGTSGYMAPELLQKDVTGKAKPTFESDVWALGVVFYFVVSDGKHPFGSEMDDLVGSIFRDHLISELKTARATNARTNQNGVLDLVFHMIDYNPENRPSIFFILYHPYFALSNSTASRYWRGKMLVHLSRSAAHNLELAIKRFYDTTTLNEWYNQLGESAKVGIPPNELETVTKLMSAIVSRIIFHLPFDSFHVLHLFT
jgi:serine/threonine protein kinase